MQNEDLTSEITKLKDEVDRLKTNTVASIYNTAFNLLDELQERKLINISPKEFKEITTYLDEVVKKPFYD